MAGFALRSGVLQRRQFNASGGLLCWQVEQVWSMNWIMAFVLAANPCNPKARMAFVGSQIHN